MKYDYILAVDLKVYSFFGNVTGGESIIIKDGYFTNELNKKYILKICTQEDCEDYINAYEYFKNTYVELFV